MSDTNKVPLSSLKSGDKFIVEGEITSIVGGVAKFDLAGVKTLNNIYKGSADEVLVTKIIPPKTAVEVGDVFRYNGDERKVLAIHDKGLWVESSFSGLSTVHCTDRGRFYLDTDKFEFIRNEPVE
jgi:hypothetical protein